MTVSGLLPGQQIVRTIDGVYHLVSPVESGQITAQSLHQGLQGAGEGFEEILNQGVQQDTSQHEQQEDGTLLVSRNIISK